jgi:DNA-binding transcriptional LysR family regulator
MVPRMSRVQGVLSGSRPSQGVCVDGAPRRVARAGAGGYLDRRQLAAVLAVAEELHFGRAAERLGLQQSALSQLVRRLEEQLGFSLFDRSSHHVRVTHEGEQILAAAREVLAALRRAEELAGDIATGRSGRLRMGTTPGVYERLYLILERFHARHAGVEVQLTTTHTAAKLRALLAGELDVALVRGARGVEGIDMLELWRESLAVMLSRRHPLADREQLSIVELAPYPVRLVSREHNRWAREHYESLFADAGAEPLLGIQGTTLQESLAIVDSVARG